MSSAFNIEVEAMIGGTTTKWELWCPSGFFSHLHTKSSINDTFTMTTSSIAWSRVSRDGISRPDRTMAKASLRWGEGDKKEEEKEMPSLRINVLDDYDATREKKHKSGLTSSSWWPMIHCTHALGLLTLSAWTQPIKLPVTKKPSKKGSVSNHSSKAITNNLARCTWELFLSST